MPDPRQPTHPSTTKAKPAHPLLPGDRSGAASGTGSRNAPATQPNTTPLTPDQSAQERVLVERIRTGRRPGASREESDDARMAMGELVEQYQGRVYSVCLRMLGTGSGDRETALDLSHDALLKVIQGLESFDARSRLSTWIIRIAMNVCLSHLRSSKVRRHKSLDAGAGPDIAGSLLRGLGEVAISGETRATPRELEPVESVQRNEDTRRVLAAMSVLDPDQRAVLVLRDMQGLDYDQIGAALEVAVGTVKSRLFRARLALRDALTEKA